MKLTKSVTNSLATDSRDYVLCLVKVENIYCKLLHLVTHSVIVRAFFIEIVGALVYRPILNQQC